VRRRLVFFAVLASVPALAADPESQPAHGPWRVEVSLSPVVGQLNDLWVRQLGLGGQVAFAMAPHMRFVAGGSWNHTWRTSGMRERLDTGRLPWSGPVGGPTDFFTPAGAWAGTEVGLIHGHVAPFRFPHRFELVVQGLAGAFATRVELKPVSAGADGRVVPPTSGDTGLRPTLAVGAGLHFEFLERFSLRLEVKHFAISSRATSVNGCSVFDLREMDQALRGGSPVTTAAVGQGCRASTFDGIDPDTGYRRSNDVPLALAMLRTPSALFSSLLTGSMSVGVTF
jgi:hypothetical protein